LYDLIISIHEDQSTQDKSREELHVISLISNNEACLYFGITNNKNLGSTFFIEIDIELDFLILGNFLENQFVFVSLKYGGENVIN